MNIIKNLEQIKIDENKKKHYYSYKNVKFLTNCFLAIRLIVIFHGTRSNNPMPIFRGYDYFFKDSIVLSISDPLCELYPNIKIGWYLDTHKLNITDVVIEIVQHLKTKCNCVDVLFCSNCSGALFAFKLSCILKENLLIGNPHLVLSTTSHWTKESIDAGFRMPLTEEEIKSGKRLSILHEEVKNDPNNFFINHINFDAVEIIKYYGLPNKILAITHELDYTVEGMNRVADCINSLGMNTENFRFIFHSTPTDSPHHTPFPFNKTLKDYIEHYDVFFHIDVA